MRAYQTAGRGGGVRESAVKWSGKNEFLSGKSQWKVREFHFRLRVGTLYKRCLWIALFEIKIIRQNIGWMLIMLRWMLEQQLIQMDGYLAVALLLLIHCLMLLPLFVGTVCFILVLIMHYSHVVSFLVLQSSWRGRESWLLDFNCLPGVLWLSVVCGTSSQCRGLVCSVYLWYFLIKLTYYWG